MSRFPNRRQLEKEADEIAAYNETLGDLIGLEGSEPTNEKPQPPYPWCWGNPTVEDCIRHGYCKRNPNCGD